MKQGTLYIINFHPMRPKVLFLNNIVFGVQNSNINTIFLSGQQFISLMIFFDFYMESDMFS